jgi:hypothetical protein
VKIARIATIYKKKGGGALDVTLVTGIIFRVYCYKPPSIQLYMVVSSVLKSVYEWRPPCQCKLSNLQRIAMQKWALSASRCFSHAILAVCHEAIVTVRCKIALEE